MATSVGLVSIGGQEPWRPSADGLADCVRACLRARQDPAALDALRAALGSGQATWEALLRQLADARLDGLVYPVLNDAPWTPPAMLAELRQAHARHAVANTVLLTTFADAARKLTAAGIPTLALKGAALVESVYDSLGQRPMNDLDILVPAGQAAAAAELLLAEGYRWAAPTDLAAALEFENELMLRRPGPIDIVIELHWHLINAPYYQRRLPMDWFWETSRPLQVGGVATRTLGPEAQVLYLCAHLVLHHGQQRDLELRLLADIAAVLRLAGPADRAIDWDLVLRQAQAWDLVIALQRALSQAAERLGAPVPIAVLDAMDRMRPSEAEARVVAAMTAPDPSVAARFRADMAGLSGARARLRFIARNVFPSADYMRQRYSEDGVGLPRAYLRRWWLGLSGAVRSLGRR
ncbi:MAG: nucleotidyltransferase family protein [Anaerolineae bacterium]|nr:nucleotidyltransferase family protein [Ardenticatenia bacterium]